jgi:hypothetical protein
VTSLRKLDLNELVEFFDGLSANKNGEFDANIFLGIGGAG